LPELVLASGSPQRRQILEDLGVRFVVRPQDVIEEDEGVPLAVASENALRKAVSGARELGRGRGGLVIGCDTLVATDFDIWGKPSDEEAARRTLRRLSGRTHEVISGLAVVQDGDIRATTEITKVTFRELDDRTIDAYVASGEWRGRAGGYAIQKRGALLVRHIEGDYLNVVGLPVAALLELSPGITEDYAAAR
jgi:septum formation protein